MAGSEGRRVLLGRVVGVHGVRGGVKVESFTEPRGKIFDYQPWILLSNGAERVVRAQPIAREGRIAALLEGVGERDAAAALAGTEVWVRREQLPPPAPGAFYWSDLEGLAVANLDGAELGCVDHLFETGSNDVMVVRRDDDERLIPFTVGDCVRSVDFDAGRIVVDWDADF